MKKQDIEDDKQSAQSGGMTQRSHVKIQEEEFMNEDGQIETRRTVTKTVVVEKDVEHVTQPSGSNQQGVTPPGPLTEQMKNSAIPSNVPTSGQLNPTDMNASTQSQPIIDTLKLSQNADQDSKVSNLSKKTVSERTISQDEPTIEVEIVTESNVTANQEIKIENVNQAEPVQTPEHEIVVNVTVDGTN